MIPLAIGIATLAIAAAWLIQSRSVDVLIRRTVKRQVVIELRSGATFRGIVAATDRYSIVLRNVEALGGAQTATTPVDGELLVPRADVKFMQRP